MISTLFGEEKEKVEVEETVKSNKPLPWDYTNAIYKHDYILDSEEMEKGLKNPFYFTTA